MFYVILLWGGCECILEGQRTFLQMVIQEKEYVWVLGSQSDEPLQTCLSVS